MAEKFVSQWKPAIRAECGAVACVRLLQGSAVTEWGQETGMGEGRKVQGKPGRTAIPMKESA